MYKDQILMPAGLSVRLPSGEALQEPREGEHILCPGYFHRGLGFPLRDFMRVNLWFVVRVLDWRVIKLARPA